MSAYAAQARATEFGIRIALGAPRSSLLWLAVRDSAYVAVVGAAVGIPLAWLVARRLRNVLFEVTPFDLPTIACAGGALVFVVIAATLVPARRASLVDPTLTMRAE
jgi:ABC-type antimicrobial peptide transport system permease subunit